MPLQSTRWNAYFYVGTAAAANDGMTQDVQLGPLNITWVG
jgi:hypothetical protein